MSVLGTSTVSKDGCGMARVSMSFISYSVIGQPANDELNVGKTNIVSAGVAIIYTNCFYWYPVGKLPSDIVVELDPH